MSPETGLVHFTACPGRFCSVIDDVFGPGCALINSSVARVRAALTLKVRLLAGALR
jgi:hypothetical protein